MQHSLLSFFMLMFFGVFGVKAQPADGQWTTNYVLPGLNGGLTDYLEKDGIIYAVGDFTIGSEILPLTRATVAAYDGQVWTKLNSGIITDDHRIFALAFAGDTLYIQSSSGLASYFNNEWKYVITQNENNQVQSVRGIASGLHYDGQQLHIFGAVTLSNSTLKDHYVYDFKTFKNIGAGFNGKVNTVIGSSSNLYFGGNFTATADGVTTLRGIARWDGVSFSEPFYVQSSHEVVDLTRIVPNEENGLEVPVIYAATRGPATFNDQQGNTYFNTDIIAFKNGIIEPLLVNGNPIRLNLSDIQVEGIGDSLVIKNFSTVQVYHPQRGLSVDLFLERVLSTNFSKILVTNDKLYVASYNLVSLSKEIAGPLVSLDLQTNSWQSETARIKQTDGFYGQVNRLVEWKGDLYAFGNFVYSDLSKGIHGMARKTANGWEAIANHDIKLTEIYAIEPTESGLYIGGNFTNLTSENGTLSHFALFNGSTFETPFDGNPDRWVYDIKLVNDRLYIAGSFTKLGSVDAKALAYLRNGNITSMVTGETQVVINDIHVEPFDDDGFTVYRVFATGSFTNLNGVENADNIAYYNGTNWTGIGQGLTGSGLGITRFQDTVYVAAWYSSNFINPNGNENLIFAKWKGDRWERVIPTLNSNLFRFAATDTGMALYSITFNPFRAAAFYNGNELKSLVPADYPYAGGILDVIQKQDSVIYATSSSPFGHGMSVYKWGETVSIENDSELPNGFMLGDNYPNPFNPTTRIPFSVKVSAPVSLTVYNVLGQRVATLINNQMMSAGSYEFNFDASRLASGTYFYQLQQENNVVTKSMVLIK